MEATGMGFFLGFCRIEFYKDEKENSPITDFLDELPAKVAQKVVWVLKLIEDHDIVPKTYYKKLVNTDDI